MKGIGILRRLVGLFPKHEATTTSGEKPHHNVGKAPPCLAERMEAIRNLPRPSMDEVEAQMDASARKSRLLDRGMSEEQIKEFIMDHDVAAHVNAPWRTKIGENRYEGSCGCIFDSEGNRIEWCGDHY